VERLDDVDEPPLLGKPACANPQSALVGDLSLGKGLLAQSTIPVAAARLSRSSQCLTPLPHARLLVLHHHVQCSSGCHQAVLRLFARVVNSELVSGFR